MLTGWVYTTRGFPWLFDTQGNHASLCLYGRRAAHGKQLLLQPLERQWQQGARHIFSDWLYCCYHVSWRGDQFNKEQHRPYLLLPPERRSSLLDDKRPFLAVSVQRCFRGNAEHCWVSWRWNFSSITASLFSRHLNNNKNNLLYQQTL